MNLKLKSEAIFTSPIVPEPFAKGRHGKDAPVKKDAKLCIVVPRRKRPRI